ncbi:MAG TPA: histidine kinase [Candidatus Acidoferrales bacterium]|jgi:two-component system LytT family sensor kinase|nr:histidine kinase [Candidatus Acidoferrales bacterium]
MRTLTFGGDLLLTLLLHVGAAASICAWLARSATFRKVLFTELRDSDQKLKLMLFVTPPLAFGVFLRIVGQPYRAADLMLEGSFLLGLLGGRVVGPLGGSLISLPAFMHREWLSMPVAAAAGLVGGLIRQTLPNTEEIWRLGPYTFLSTPRWLVRVIRRKKVTWEMLPLGSIIVLELARQALGHVTKIRWLFYLDAGKSWGLALVLLSTVMAVAVPMKIWSNTRLEMNLEQHQQLLLKARMDALTAQINPHFLFNTLNTVSSLIRYDPDTARGVVIKLSNILRRLLRKHETFVPLQEELDFIDDYLDIEVARFGRENLVVHKEVNDDTLEAFVPSMLLQPIVENALKHGLAGKLSGGELTIRTELQDGRLRVAIEDNGVGIPKDRIAQVFQDGIGISNVHERLRVLYGADFRMDIESKEGEGTRIRIEIPELVPTAADHSVIFPASKI